MEGYSVEKISYEETKDLILGKHYAQRMPSISYSYGLKKCGDIVGVLTLGKPVSHWLCVEICGEDHSDKVFELNRLIVEDNLEKNVLSWFVSRVLRDLKEDDLIIVSYADDGVGHKGYIYQATNFIYTGATRERTDKYVEGNRHSRHYGDDNQHLRKVRTSKHRYVYFTNNRKKYIKLLKYPIKPYPKGNNKKYVLGERFKTKVIDRNTGRSWWE